MSEHQDCAKSFGLDDFRNKFSMFVAEHAEQIALMEAEVEARRHSLVGFSNLYLDQFDSLRTSLMASQSDNSSHAAAIENWLEQGKDVPQPVPLILYTHGIERGMAAIRECVQPLVIHIDSGLSQPQVGQPVKKEGGAMSTRDELDKVPQSILDRIAFSLERLREIREGIDRAADLEKQFGMAGRYQADAFTNRKADIESAQRWLAEFRVLAKQNEVDGDALIASLGGEPDLTPSKEAQAWLDDPRGPVVTTPRKSANTMRM